MQKEKTIGGPYNEDYAARYNDIWIHSETWAPEVRNLINTLTPLIKPDTTWLDCGCGTGYILSQFPGVRRAGMDLSEAMLGQANKANPDALFFRQMNILDDAPEWQGTWDLVTCTGQPYSYLKTIEEIEKVAENLAKWTSENGMCVVLPGDIFDLTYTKLPTFYQESEIPDNSPVVKAVIWNLKENGVVHENMIWPNFDQWVRWMSLYFKNIEVQYWPYNTPILRIPRRVLICSNKREPGDNQPATVTEKNLSISELGAFDLKKLLSSVSNKQLITELAKRILSGKILKLLQR
jgi:SAM-dependent methyltransferase